MAVVVLDDDETVTFVESDYTVREGQTVEIIVRLSEDPERTVAIPIVAAPQGNASADDFSGVPGEVTFESGDTEKTSPSGPWTTP